ncbi:MULTISPECIES: hypothetical protein [Bartonella]|uniref:hypothetical protein n=1 Tax=Bartonella TaxID=773 RepID=UPI0002D3282F
MDTMIMLLKAMAELSRLRIPALFVPRRFKRIKLYIYFLPVATACITVFTFYYTKAQLIECYQKGGGIYFALS